MSEELRKTIMDAIRSVSERADEFKAGCATFDGEWPDAEDKAIYDAEIALVERLRVALASISDAAQAPLPAIQGYDLATSVGGCGYLVEYFATRLRTHTYQRYIEERLAKDFACALSTHLSELEAAPVAADAAAPSDNFISRWTKAIREMGTEAAQPNERDGG